MISKKEALNSKSDILIARTNYARCWYCQLNGYDIFDEWNCCKRCGTNLKKWSKRGKLIYPNLDNEKLAQEVLGTREKCDVSVHGRASTAQPIVSSEKERVSGKVNHCQICWQKTIVFIWSTSRAIDKEKLEKIEQFKNVVNLERLGYPICWACIKEHTLIVSTGDEKK